MTIAFETKEEMCLFVGGIVKAYAGEYCPSVFGLNDHCENERCGTCWTTALEEVSFLRKGDNADESMQN